MKSAFYLALMCSEIHRHLKIPKHMYEIIIHGNEERMEMSIELIVKDRRPTRACARIIEHDLIKHGNSREFWLRIGENLVRQFYEDEIHVGWDATDRRRDFSVTQTHLTAPGPKIPRPKMKLRMESTPRTHEPVFKRIKEIEYSKYSIMESLMVQNEKSILQQHIPKIEHTKEEEPINERYYKNVENSSTAIVKKDV